MTSVYWNLARFWFNVPYAIDIEKKMIKMIKENAKKKKILPTYPNFFEHVSLNTYSYFLALHHHENNSI